LKIDAETKIKIELETKDDDEKKETFKSLELKYKENLDDNVRNYQMFLM
jgi:hypothetical protein